ncbi:hypothetical protein [Massilia sp. CFBP9026]|uniref:hypothetical protein n=1 Tax=Massilia sp. CFBP9026 TaxID=3096536 RepID=UPI002A69B08E|nr:hypothetical protein [Massilia sp. CFBP9026]MDY0965410.1 hypothetical protein [Massilia sp. CFBP9026]
MTLHRMPRAGSRAHSVLLHLARCGGTSTPLALLGAIDYPRTRAEFDVAVIGLLERQGLVVRSNETVLLTVWGRQLVEPEPAPAAEAAVVTPGRYAPPMRPLSLKNRPRLVSMRPGSLAYRDIPSRMANELVDHVEKATA